MIQPSLLARGVIDVMPTVLEVIGAPAPLVYQGVAQLPVHGVSMAYTFAAPDAPTTRRVQHYELFGDRALWCDGWKAVARQAEGDDFRHKCVLRERASPNSSTSSPTPTRPWTWRRTPLTPTCGPTWSAGSGPSWTRRRRTAGRGTPKVGGSPRRRRGPDRRPGRPGALHPGAGGLHSRAKRHGSMNASGGRARPDATASLWRMP